MEVLEQICVELISHVGVARSNYIEAIQKAKAGDYAEAEACMKAGKEEYLLGHDAHFELIQKEARGEHIQVPLILIHAEDQMMSAEAFQVIVEELIASYKKINQMETIVSGK